jgi:hypothetical protein
MGKKVAGSLARIADLDSRPYVLEITDQERWDTGDYVEAVVTGRPSELYSIENTKGEMIPVEPGDVIIGALGHRAATLEGVGSWTEVRGGQMQCLTNAGLIGAFTSLSTFLPQPIALEYSGHIVRARGKVRMADFALQSEHEEFNVPTILLVGTSMSAGKTATGRQVIAELVQRGYDVIGAKLTGAGRYRDILSFRAAGASEIFDFVDVGLPSTVVAEDEFRNAIRPLLRYIDERGPDFLVAEAGASPLEPYNSDVAIDELGNNICCTILCASDPYAVLGVQKAFDLKPDIVSGPATTTSAARELVMKLSGVEAYNILDPGSLPGFQEALLDKLGVDPG